AHQPRRPAQTQHAQAQRTKQDQLNHLETRLERLLQENRCGESARAILPNPRAIGQARKL
ncbi:MAG TPA: hypothetical protein VD835_17165, partial [Pyrinomonadaceae bacterium]|nr:hypothetical protein [Pyrinomonadaceae bacterium]